MEKQKSLSSTSRPVRVSLIGEFRVYDSNGHDITPAATKARCVLAILILENTGTVSRKKISQLLWSRHDTEQAMGSLRKSLGILRHVFSSTCPDFISADRNNIYIQLDKAQIDTHEIVKGAADRANFKGEVLENLEAGDSEFEHWLNGKKRSLQQEINTFIGADSGVMTSPRQLLYRDSLLKKVKAFWVEGLLEHSLVSENLIELALKQTSGHLYKPWEDIVPQLGSESRFFPMATGVVGIFKELNESMLILGAPGSGKTTLLLSLAKRLVERAEKSINLPIPVILHLSTWSDQYTDFPEWVIDELENRYQMPKKLSAEIIDSNGLLFLLDGLDEVDVDLQAGCIQAINKFQNQPKPVLMAVCSRQADYKKTSQQLALAGAVVVQPISSAQLDGYLKNISTTTQGLSAALSDNSELKGLLTTPLMISIATTAYQDYHANSPANKISSCDTPQDQLFFTYVQAMFRSHTKNIKYTQAQSARWLGCLAHLLADKKHSLFYLDDIQLDDSATPLQRWIVSSGTIHIFGLLTILAINFAGPHFCDSPTNLLLFGLSTTGCYFLSKRPGSDSKIKPLVHMRLSLTVLREKFFLKLAHSAITGAILAVGGSLLLGPTFPITIGIYIFFILMITNSLDYELSQHKRQQLSNPNDVIHKSLQHALIATVIGTVLGAALGAAVSQFTNDPQNMMLVGLTLGVLSGLYFGGHDCIRHYLLRYFLWRKNRAPLHYIPFLEFSVARGFLYRVGGGYIFIHRSLAECFAKNL